MLLYQAKHIITLSFSVWGWRSSNIFFKVLDLRSHTLTELSKETDARRLGSMCPTLTSWLCFVWATSASVLVFLVLEL